MKPTEVLVANPVIRGGIPVVYLGAGSIDIIGEATGTTYHVGSRQRHIRVHRADADGILERRDFMLRA
jgi:hypothetical protein